MTLIKSNNSRRSFLKVSAAGGTGLLLQFNWLSGFANSVDQPLAKDVQEINAYIKINLDGTVTIFSPNPEIGQNVKTSMPLIVAEELDVAWDQVTVEQAPLDTTKYTRQLAGGSQSIRQGWDSLRKAGATARYLMVAAAGKKWEVPLTDLSTENGEVIHNTSGRKIAYKDLLQDAVTIDLPSNVKVKDPKDFKLIGTYVKNVDGKSIVTGQPLFGLDYIEEDAAIAMIVHPPAFGLQMKSLDASAAKTMSGIHDVFTISTKLTNPTWSDINAFHDLVVVVGKTTWQVLKAKKALQIEWERVSPAEDTALHYNSLENVFKSGAADVKRVDGDVEKAYKNAVTIVEKDYTGAFLAHNTLEPMNFFAHVTNTKAKLVGPIQTPENLRASASSMLGIPVANIEVEMTRMGGGFGRRLYGNFGLEAAAISQKYGGPIKLIYAREDDMTQGTFRPSYHLRYKAGLDANGKLIAFEVKGAGIPSSPIFPDRYPAGTLANYKATNFGVETNISTGAWRAPGSNFVAGAEQSFIDEVAEAAGKDPIDFRLELFENAIQNPIGNNNDYDAKRYAGVLKLIREKSNWDTKMEGVSRGVAAYYCHNSYVAQVVDLVKDESGNLKIKKVWCAVDCGIVVNKEGAINQIEGGIVDGIGHAMFSQLTFKDGATEQQNFNTYRLIRNNEAPQAIEVFFLDNGMAPTGLGEPSLPPISAALANALYQAEGSRYYKQPFMVLNQKKEALG